MSIAATSSIGIMLLVAAVALLTNGARLVKPAVFLSAFLIAAAIAFNITEAMLSVASTTPTTSCCERSHLRRVALRTHGLTARARAAARMPRHRPAAARDRPTRDRRARTPPRPPRAQIR